MSKYGARSDGAPRRLPSDTTLDGFFPAVSTDPLPRRPGVPWLPAERLDGGPDQLVLESRRHVGIGLPRLLVDPLSGLAERPARASSTRPSRCRSIAEISHSLAPGSPAMAFSLSSVARLSRQSPWRYWTIASVYQ